MLLATKLHKNRSNLGIKDLRNQQLKIGEDNKATPPHMPVLAVMKVA